MAKEKEILTAFAEEMRRHNYVKRRILFWGRVIAWGVIFLFVIIVFSGLIYTGFN